MLDIDRDRQRISLGLKQTQTDPWQQVLESYGEDDVVEGRVTKVVTFGAFVEILPGVEGLVHISELAQHHVENPREVVAQGDAVNVQIIEIDAERRRLSLSLKRVEEDEEPLPRADGGESVHLTPNLESLRGRLPGRSRRPRRRTEALGGSSAERCRRPRRAEAEARRARGRAERRAEPEAERRARARARGRRRAGARGRAGARAGCRGRGRARGRVDRRRRGCRRADEPVADEPTAERTRVGDEPETDQTA